jgi:hypothetical protein
MVLLTTIEPKTNSFIRNLEMKHSDIYTDYIPIPTMKNN